MGYSTDFYGEWSVTPPLTPERIAYLKAFADSRRVKRDFSIVEGMYDPVRAAVGLDVGVQGGYYVNGDGWKGQGNDPSIANGNEPPAGQPGLWCQWIPSDDGAAILWDGGEKFYEYTSWISYLIDNFLNPWGHFLNGEVEWQGEDSDDRGMIRIVDNKVSVGYGAPVSYQFSNTTTGGSTPMATKTAPTITATVAAPVPAGGTALPAAVPAAVLARKTKTPATTSKNVHNFAAWKGAIGTAQAATGYDPTSPIYGKTDIEVLTALKQNLESMAIYAVDKNAVATVLADATRNEIHIIDELLKRKVAKQIAGQTYKSRKTI